MLGFGDFYYELAVQIIEVCMAASHRTGGLMEAGELRTRLLRSRGLGRKNKSGQQTTKNQVQWLLDFIRKISTEILGFPGKNFW